LPAGLRNRANPYRMIGKAIRSSALRHEHEPHVHQPNG
jgi:hypothetical protein